MASPQKENGFIPIANEIVEHLVSVKMSGTEWQYVMCLFRKTYGWNKTEDWITNSQIVVMTGLKKERVSEAKSRLIARNIVTEKRNKISFQKDWEQWKELRKSVLIVTEKRISLLRKSVHTKDTNTKDKRVPDSNESDLSIKGKKMYNYTPVDEDGNPRRRATSGKGKEVKARNAELINLGFLFEKLGEQSTGVKPDLTKSYFILKNAKEKCGVQDFESLYQYFFSDPKLLPEQKVSLAFCCSPSYITQWKVNQKNKPVSQASLAHEMRL